MITVQNQNPATEGKGTANQSKEETEINRQVAKFTAYLGAVGFLQCVILFIQAILFYRQTKIMRQHKVSLEELATAAGVNARAIEAQAVIIDGQLKAMGGQLEAIEVCARRLAMMVYTEELKVSPMWVPETWKSASGLFVLQYRQSTTPSSRV